MMKEKAVQSPSPSVSALVAVVVFVILCGGGSAVPLPNNATVPALIAFGDSIVDQGNNNRLKTIVKCNFPPYGRDFPGGAPTGRFSNSRTPADLLVEEINIKEYLPAYLDPNLKDEDIITGVSFASGATGYDPQTPKLVNVLSFPKQLEMFKEYIARLKRIVGDKAAKKILAEAIYIVVGGTDDLANTYYTIGIRKLQYDVPSYSRLMADSASDFLQKLYALGARRIGFFGIAPVGCLPSQRTLAGGKHRNCSEEYNEAAMVVNSYLSSLVDSLSLSLPDSKLVYIDIYESLLNIIENPKEYGFEVVEKGCCGTGALEVSVLCNKFSPICSDNTKYLFWDSYHPTEKGYKALVDILVKKYIDRFF